jgi:hypothetical protein
MKYQIELSENQLIVMRTALEFYSRFLGGSWTIPYEMVSNERINQVGEADFYSRRNSAEQLLNLAKEIFIPFLENGGTYGIGSDRIDENALIAYDMYRPIYEHFATEGVYTHPSHPYSEEGRIEINIKK